MRALQLGHLVLLLQPSACPQHRELNRALGSNAKRDQPWGSCLQVPPFITGNHLWRIYLKPADPRSRQEPGAALPSPRGPGTTAAGRTISGTEGAALRSDRRSAPERSPPPTRRREGARCPRSAPRPRPGHSHGAEPAGPGPAAANRAEPGALRPVPAAPLRLARPRRTGRAHPPRCGDNAAGIRPAARAPPHFRDTPVTSRYARACPAPHFRPRRGALIGSGRTRAIAARTAAGASG